MKVRFSVDTGKRRGRKDSCGDSSCGNVSIRWRKSGSTTISTFLLPPLGKIMRYRMCFVMPPLKEIYLGKDRWYNETNEDSDRFSLYKRR